jgi:hypothetical protein
MATKKKQPRNKIGEIKLTDHQREVISQNVDSEFFKIMTEVIIPQRVTQIALTLLHGGQDEKDLFFYKGMTHLTTWFGNFITGEAEKIDTDNYDNDDEGVDAKDDSPN